MYKHIIFDMTEKQKTDLKNFIFEIEQNIFIERSKIPESFQHELGSLSDGYSSHTGRKLDFYGRFVFDQELSDIEKLFIRVNDAMTDEGLRTFLPELRKTIVSTVLNNVSTVAEFKQQFGAPHASVYRFFNRNRESIRTRKLNNGKGIELVYKPDFERTWNQKKKSTSTY